MPIYLYCNVISNTTKKIFFQRFSKNFINCKGKKYINFLCNIGEKNKIKLYFICIYIYIYIYIFF